MGTVLTEVEVKVDKNTTEERDLSTEDEAYHRQLEQDNKAEADRIAAIEAEAAYARQRRPRYLEELRKFETDDAMDTLGWQIGALVDAVRSLRDHLAPMHDLRELDLIGQKIDQIRAEIPKIGT